MYYLFSSIARIMPTKFMLLHFLAALYICNGIAAGDLEFGETLFNHYRVALHRRDIVSISESSGCPSDWVPCPTGGGCCPLVSQCSFNSKGQGTCNIPCGPASFTCAGACCQEGTTCSGTLCVISSDEGKFSVSLEPGHRCFGSNNVLS
jgi:hypothetical protein